MSLNIMIAGCGKDERETIEKSIRDAFGGHAESDAWNVSLVNVANQWSVEMDGTEPRFKGLSFVAPAEDLAASVRRALKAAGAEEPAAARPPSPKPPPPSPTPSPTPTPEREAPAAVSPSASPPPPSSPPALVEPELPVTASVPSTTAPPSEASLPVLELEPEPEPKPEPQSAVEQTLSSRPAPLSQAPAPAAARAVQTPLVDGDRTERHQCEGCSAAFDVFYYALAGERMERCPVACPSCWHVNNVPIAAGAGLNGDYRAQAAS